jgi:hypothetical protein
VYKYSISFIREKGPKNINISHKKSNHFILQQTNVLVKLESDIYVISFTVSSWEIEPSISRKYDMTICLNQRCYMFTEHYLKGMGYMFSEHYMKGVDDTCLLRII